MSGTPADAVFIDALGLGEAVSGIGALEIGGGLAGAATAAEATTAASTMSELAGWDAASAGLSAADLAPMTGYDFGGFGSYASEMMGSSPATSMSSLGWSDIKPWIGPAMSIGSGLFGMSQADQMRRMAMLAAGRSDPWGASGGRGVADAQLQELLRNPGGVASSDPAYKLRIQGAQRAMGPMGQGSGAMAVAGANASTDWYNQRLSQLAGISGAGVNPGYGEQIAMQGNLGANDLASKSLASIGYGVTRATGGGTALPPAVQKWFQEQGFA